MRVFTLMARRSFGLSMLAAMLGIVLLHIFAREHPWTHEWFWGAYQFNFVTVMLAPVVAGIAAWEGVRFARGRTLLETSNRVLAGLLGIWAALLVWVFLAYAIGLAIVVVMVKLAGTPGLPELDALVALIPALALLAAAGAIGLAIGWMVKNPLAAPACAVGCFLLILLLYLRGPSQLVIVGGATDSLLALRPRPELQAAQVLCYLACSLAALVLAAHTVGGSRRYHPGVLPALGSLAVLSVVLVVAQGGIILQPHTPRLRCYGANPEVCAGLGYVRRLSAARAALLPYLRVLETAGVPVPRRFSQGQEPGNPEVGPLSLRLLQGRRDEAGLLVMAAYFQKRCDLKANPGVIEAHQYASFWLEAKATGAQLDDPTIPRALRGGDPQEQERWIRNAMRQIRRCGA